MANIKWKGKSEKWKGKKFLISRPFIFHFKLSTHKNMKTFEELEVWQKGRELVKMIYSITNQGQFAKDFGLRDQIRRAGVSIISNIAEGFERDGTKEFIRFLSISKASAGEVRAQLYVTLDQEYINQKIFDELYHRILEISRMLSGLITSLRKKI